MGFSPALNADSKKSIPSSAGVLGVFGVFGVVGDDPALLPREEDLVVLGIFKEPFNFFAALGMAGRV